MSYDTKPVPHVTSTRFRPVWIDPRCSARDLVMIVGRLTTERRATPCRSKREPPGKLYRGGQGVVQLEVWHAQ